MKALINNKKGIFDDKSFSNKKNLYNLFEERANSVNCKTAVIDKNGKYSYRYLFKAADDLAQCLLLNRIKKNVLVAVLCEKGVFQVISVLGIIKAGAAYLPLDEDWPSARVEEILKEGRAKHLIITKKQLKKIKNKFDLNSYKIIIIDELQRNAKPTDKKYIPHQANLKDIAYVIFTSGSTGKPKGVVIHHAGAINTINAINKRFNIKKGDRLLALSKLSFDLSVYDIFGLLAAGGVIVFPDDEKTKDPAHWYELIIKHKITLWNSVPQFMQILIDYVTRENKKLLNLKYIMLSGDKIPLKLPEHIKSYIKNTIVMSLGGATEASIWSIWYEIKNVDIAWKSIPYGQAMPNQQIHILDDQYLQCGINKIGGIYIGGLGVAAGYWNDKKRTAESFINHPLLGRLFKTGDLGSQNENGYIEFHGRIDQQVKLNGHRIELEEISNKICLYPGIGKAVVLIKLFKGNAHIAAYYISNLDVRSDAIKKFLIGYLPQYMVPTYYFRLSSFPLTANGKLDTVALLSLEHTDVNEFIAPRNELEAKICQLWAKSLNLEKIGIKDDFFYSGGDSIAAIHLAYKLSEELGFIIKPTKIFSYPNVMTFLASIKHEKERMMIRKLSRDEKILSYQQEAILEDDLRIPNISSFPMAFKLHKGVSISLLKISLINIINKHEILRTIYQKKSKSKWYQIVKKSAITILEKIITEKKLKNIFQKVYHEKFDLTQEYPIKIRIYHCENISYLLIIIHNIAFDGWSINVFMEDLEAEYLKSTSGEAPKKNISIEIQYKEFALWQRKYLSGSHLQKMIQYWLKSLQGYKPFHFIERKLSKAKATANGRYIDFYFDKVSSKKLRKLAYSHGTTLYTIFLAALYVLIYKKTMQNDLAIVSMIANRPYRKTGSLIGYFVNKIILRMKIDIKKPFINFIQEIHNKLIRSEHYQEAPFELIMSNLGLKHADEQHTFLPIMLNVHDFRARLSNHLLQDYMSAFPIQQYFDIAKFGIGFFINDSPGQLKGIINYATCLYDESFILTLKESYLSILRDFIKNNMISIEQCISL